MQEIRLAQIKDAERLLIILNETTLDLHKKGISQWKYPWNEHRLVNQIKNNTAYAFVIHGDIIGTFCLETIELIGGQPVEAGSLYLSQIAILPKYQGKSLGSAIIHFASSLASKTNKPLYLDCWSGNERLEDFYVRHGFESIGNFPEEDYLIRVFKYKEAQNE
ncbi:GNAT family N-acetyltransferase [Halalkalibacterium halodurans]|uniref:GNAT family N-acetyltransferase n=1 Tax=Halalkalibacterium halodurans TaxID=86665 RepID=UPI002AAA2CF3|nr:GNAT family N-acetyltransferase [Halalkalibacterium halodurans]MDY7224183.1 GNAT family N-acetyltransferase [Halalkalibacterium halodurans]MDY7243468.1 GNAT family N-acetyltransferase [Halalkalibacterium halodurans]